MYGDVFLSGAMNENKKLFEKQWLLAEEKAAEFLVERGYTILERNFRARGGEIDIIAQKEEFVCFVEVRSRSVSDFGAPELSVNRKKRANIERSALQYIAKKQLKNYVFRFDIISVLGEGMEIRHFPNAFQSRR